MRISIFIQFLLAAIVANTVFAGDSSTRLGGSNDTALEIILASSVAEDPNDQIVTSNAVVALGDFKYSLDGSLNIPSGQSSAGSPVMKVVKDSITGRIGLTNGQLIIEYVEGENGAYLASDYGLAIVSQLSSINRVVVQLVDFGEYKQLQTTLGLDTRVISTELDVYYGGYKPQ